MPRASNYARNKERLAALRAASREARRVYDAEYYQQNKGRRRQYNIDRKYRLNQAAVSAGCAAQIEEFYKTARKLTEETGVMHVVDHIWPIYHKDFCGLHVSWNLQVITQRENDSKGNKRPEASGSSVLNMESYDAKGNERIYYIRRESKPGGFE